MSSLSRQFGAFVANLRYEDLPPAAVHEAKRGLIDWIGCALAGSRHKTIDMLLAVLRSVGGQPQAIVFGRGLKLGLLEAPVANGQMGHLLDFDDTHMGGVVLHTSSPVLAALFALSERKPVSGADLMLAYAVGFEAGVRSGRTAPGHHKGGWHLTGTLGSIAAGVASGKLIGLDTQRLTYAMGISATQAAGMQQNRGTMCKSFHAGKAASNGVLAALLAERGFDSTQEIIEGKKGFAPRFALDVYRLQLATGNLRSADDYMEMAQLAAQAGYPEEGKKVVEQGLAANVLGQGAEGARHKRLLDLMVKKSNEAKADAANAEKAANDSKTGDELVKLGLSRVFGGDKAGGLKLVEAGIAKDNFTRADDAKFYQGLAYYNAGEVAKAQSIWRGVKGTDGSADLARLWTVVASR